jgi:hypothetical protein
MSLDDGPVPDAPDWQPLRRAFIVACSDQRVFLPRQVARELVDAVIDALTADGVELVEADQ